MTVNGLKEELKKRSLPVSGKKDELVARIIKNEGLELPKPKKQKTDDSQGKDEKQEASVSKESPTKKQGTLLGFVQVKKAPQKPDGAWMKSVNPEDIEKIPKHHILNNLSEESWRAILAKEFSKPYFKKILDFLDSEKEKGKKIFPPEKDIFNALNLTPFDKIKAVIIGQDPYHNDGQAHGLCFSVQKGVNPPPSLKNIFKELSNDIPGFQIPNHGNLEAWAREGVLLLNATLTVEAHVPNSHSSIGWQEFTSTIIEIINEKKNGVVFLLWGSFAQKKGNIVSTTRHLVLNAPHPSPLANDKFLGCKTFSKANEYLESIGKEPINWKLPVTL